MKLTPGNPFFQWGVSAVAFARIEAIKFFCMYYPSLHWKQQTSMYTDNLYCRPSSAFSMRKILQNFIKLLLWGKKQQVPMSKCSSNEAKGRSTAVHVTQWAKKGWEGKTLTRNIGNRGTSLNPSLKQRWGIKLTLQLPLSLSSSSGGNPSLPFLRAGRRSLFLNLGSCFQIKPLLSYINSSLNRFNLY